MLVSPTWDDMSTFDASPELPLRALRELPSDRYRVALTLHPNIWSEYGPMRAKSWYATACRAGLILVPWHDGWQAALLAADHVIGDHESVTCYAAALGVPVLHCVLFLRGETESPRRLVGRLPEGCAGVDPLALAAVFYVARFGAARGVCEDAMSFAVRVGGQCLESTVTG